MGRFVKIGIPWPQVMAPFAGVKIICGSLLLIGLLTRLATVAVSGPLVPRIRKSKTASAFLDGVNVASLALIAVVAWQLARASLVDGVTVVLAIAASIALVWLRLNSAWLVLVGALLGLLAHTAR